VLTATIASRMVVCCKTWRGEFTAQWGANGPDSNCPGSRPDYDSTYL
jgi:hypothetical protein